jgi:hypothetical protein
LEGPLGVHYREVLLYLFILNLPVVGSSKRIIVGQPKQAKAA